MCAIVVVLAALFGASRAVAAADSARFHPDLVEATNRLETARSPEAYGDLRAVWDTWDRADPTLVEETLARFAEPGSGLGPEARVYAGLLTAYARLRRGDVAAATARIGALGYVNRWLVLGPFDNEGKGGFDMAYAPESDFAMPIVPGRAYSGKERPVRWRAVPDAFPWGFLDAESLVRPDRKVCVYAATFVSSKSPTAKARDISIWLGSGGAFKAFWNGAVVLSDSAERRFDADRFAARVRLESGDNSLVVKACSTDAAPVVSVRLANANGEPDPSLRADNSLEASARAAELVARVSKRKNAKVSQKGGPEGPIQAFERLTSKPHPSAKDLEAYARYLLTTGGDDPAVHSARNLAQRAADEEPTILRLLLAADLAEDRNQRAVWVTRAEKLVKKSAPDARVLLAKAELARQSMNFREAFPLYADVLRLEPGNLRAIRGRVELYNDVGLRRTALALLEDAMHSSPSSVLLLNMYASELRALGRETEASEVEARYASLRFDDRTLLSRLVDLAVKRRDKEAAEHWTERLAAIEADSQWALGTVARAYRALGEPERAVAAYERALELSPEDTGTLRSLADLEGELGKRDEQLTLLQRILSYEPQAKDVREYVEHLEPKTARVDESFAWDSDRFLKLRTAPAAGRNRRTLLDLTVSTVFENGLSSKYRQVVFQPLTDAAAALARQYGFGYQADSERVQLRGARVFRGDGSVDEAVESGEGAADDPSIAMYTSARTFYVQFPRLEPGDVVELRYRVDDLRSQNEFADYFGDIAYLQSSEPVAHAEYDLVTPPSRKFYFDVVKVPGIQRTTTDRDGVRVYRFFADSVPEVAPEPAMPPFPSVLGFVHASTFATWKDLGKAYWGLVHEQFDLDDETRRLARKIAQGKETPLDKVKAVYDWVIENTRYVALEFGIYGYKPHRCVQTVTRGWGDCKDKATVIVTLLKELGIDSTIVIVRSGLRGDFEGKVASLAPFDHAIVYVPSLDLYLDGTAEYTGSSELPALDANSFALRVNRGDAEIVHLPIPDPEKNVRRREITATVRKDGGAALDLSFLVEGTAAPSWRRRFHAESSRRDRLTEDLGAEFQGFELPSGPGAVSAGNLDEPEQPVSMKVHGNAPHFGRPEGENISVPVTPSFRLSPTYASLSSRRLPVRILPLGTIDDTFVVKPPPGYHVVSTPENTKGDGPFGSYSVTMEEQSGKIVVHTRLTIKVVTVLPEDYAAWKRFCVNADAALTPRLVIGPT